MIKIHNELNENLKVEQTDFAGQSEQLLNLVSALYRSGSILYKRGRMLSAGCGTW